MMKRRKSKIIEFPFFEKASMGLKRGDAYENIKVRLNELPLDLPRNPNTRVGNGLGKVGADMAEHMLMDTGDFELHHCGIDIVAKSVKYRGNTVLMELRDGQMLSDMEPNSINSIPIGDGVLNGGGTCSVLERVRRSDDAVMAQWRHDEIQIIREASRIAQSRRALGCYARHRGHTGQGDRGCRREAGQQAPRRVQ